MCAVEVHIRPKCVYLLRISETLYKALVAIDKILSVKISNEILA